MQSRLHKRKYPKRTKKMSRIDDLIKQYCPNGVEECSIAELCIPTNKGTLTQDKLTEKGKYPVINSGRELYGYYDSFNNDGERITIASRGEYAGYISYFNEKFWAGGLCYPYKVKDSNRLITKYLYYFLKYKEKYLMNNLVARGSIPALNKMDVDKFKIPVPPMEIQEEIVRILDKFTELEAELEARKKQYEYYRDKLLTFKKQL